MRWALPAAVWLVLAGFTLLFMHAATQGADEDDEIEHERADFEAAVRRLLDEGNEAAS